MNLNALTWIVFILTFGGVVLIHEFGHFIAARLSGIEVEEFGIGLPTPKALTLFTWQGTRFTLNWLPLGGFVRPKGENDPNVPGGLAAASPWKRLVVLFAGPLMNLITAVIVFALLIALEGIPVPGSVKINSVTENSPALLAGVERGDVLLAINGERVTDVQGAIDLIQANLDQPVELLLERDGKQITIMATPLSSRPKEQGALGVGLGYPTRPATISEILGGGVTITALQAATIVYVPIALIQGAIDPEYARFVGLKGMFDMFDVRLEEDINTRQEAAAAANTGAT